LETSGVNTVRLTADDAARPVLAQTGAPGQLSWRPQLLRLGGYRLDAGAAAGGGAASAGGGLRPAWSAEVDFEGPDTLAPPLAAADLVLVNDGDLAYAKVRLDPSSLQTVADHVGELEDSVARAVAWGVLWDMTRDAELPARRFAGIVLRWVAEEANSTARQKLLGLLAITLESFTAPQLRLEATVQAAERLWQLVVSAEAGSDTQLQLTRAYARHAASGPQLDRLQELLGGARSLTGLTLDTDLRWDLLSGLVAAGRAGEAQIDAGLAEDRTQAGLERAAGLRAAQPTPEAKAAAWLRAVEDPATPGETRRAIIGGWGRAKDPALLVPFVEPYFAALERVWRTRSQQTGADVATGLYPSVAADQPGADVVAASDRFLDELDPGLAPLRRLVVEGRAGVIRSAAAQAADRAAGGLSALA
jgi:aminopeptidase N